MTIINLEVIKAAHRLFLIMILISIVLLAPWPQHSDDSPASLLEWISSHILHKGNAKQAPTSSNKYYTTNYKHDHTRYDNINSTFMQGLARGFYYMGIVIVVWFTGMCVLGGSCRAYLYIEECLNRRAYSVLPLYWEDGNDNSTVDVDDDLSSLEGEFVMRDLREEEIGER